MEELFDVYDKDGNCLGVKPKSFCHAENPGVYHKPVWIWIINEQNQILVQKRASTKKFMPNLWDGSSTGHVHAGEQLDSACQREVLEELGVDIAKERFTFLGEFLAQPVWELGQVYLLELNSTENKFVFQDNEVDEVKWLNLEEFKELLFSKEFMPYNDNYKNWVLEKLESLNLTK